MSHSVNIKKSLGAFVLDIAFESKDGVLGFLGASGSGKSMTLRCIAGIEKPDEGSIVLDGVTLFDSEKHINLPPQERHVGYLFQNFALFPNMTVQKNILCGLYSEKDIVKKKKISDDMITMLGLQGLEDHYTSQLSGGQQQRAAVARILVNNPNLLLLDEPFSALDSFLREQMQAQLLDVLRIFNKKAILVTHSRDEAYQLCSNLALLDNGHILRIGGTKELFADQESRRGAILTGCKNIVDARKTGENEVEVPAWGVRFITAKPVRDGLQAIGIRAHYFNPKAAANHYPVFFVEEIEEPFAWVITFAFSTQKKNSAPIWWRIPKDRKTDVLPKELGVAPQNILLLYE